MSLHKYKWFCAAVFIWDIAFYVKNLVEGDVMGMIVFGLFAISQVLAGLYYKSEAERADALRASRTNNQRVERR